MVVPILLCPRVANVRDWTSAAPAPAAPAPAAAAPATAPATAQATAPATAPAAPRARPRGQSRPRAQSPSSSQSSCARETPYSDDDSGMDESIDLEASDPSFSMGSGGSSSWHDVLDDEHQRERRRAPGVNRQASGSGSSSRSCSSASSTWSTGSQRVTVAQYSRKRFRAAPNAPEEPGPSNASH